MRKIFLTGHNGFIGTHFLSKYGKKYQIQTSDEDLTHWDKIKELSIDADTIIHLAALTGYAQSLQDPQKFLYNNIISTLNVLEFARLRKITRIVYTNTYSYGNPKYLPIDEQHPVEVNSPYAESKRQSENLIKMYCELYGLSAISLRIFNIYGPRQKEPYLIPTIVNSIRQNNDIVINDGEPKRDHVHIFDVIDAIEQATLSNIQGFNPINIGSGRSYSNREIAELLITLSKQKLKITELKKRRENEVMDCYADIQKAKQILGWTPKIKLEDGLRQLL